MSESHQKNETEHTMTTTRIHWNRAAIVILAAVLFAPRPAVADDTTPPTITVSANPASLWPPNGKMIPVTVSGTITDSGSGVNAANVNFRLYDPYGAIQPSGPVTLAPDGSFSFTVLLQASRNDTDLAGRHYSITVLASDNAGNPGLGSAVVVVPHDLDPLSVITSMTICAPAGSGPPDATQGSCGLGTVDTLQAVVGPDHITPVNLSLDVGLTADEHSSVFPPNGLGTNPDYLFFVATQEDQNSGIGMAVLSGAQGPDLSGKWIFGFPAADAGSELGAYGDYGGTFAQVFNSPHHPGQCPSTQDQTFDLNYAAGGSVVKDSTSTPGSLLMIYEGSNDCIGNTGGRKTGDGYLSLAIATSLDYGKTWPAYPGFPPPAINDAQLPNAPMGALGADVCMGGTCNTNPPPPPAYGRYPVVTPPIPLATLMSDPQLDPGGKYGEQEISGFLDDIGGSSTPFLYANWGGMRVARAPLNRGTAPLHFKKWDGDGFEADGLWGAEMSFLPIGPFANCEAASQNQFGSSISYVEDTHQYLLIFVCTSPSDPDPEPGEADSVANSKGAAWFFSTSYDLGDPMQWTLPRKITGSWAAFPGNGECDAFNGWYPTFMSLGKDAGRLTRTGYVFSLNGCQGGGQPDPSQIPPPPSPPRRQYSSRAFTIAIGSSK
jgi:hypothetical protein